MIRRAEMVYAAVTLIIVAAVTLGIVGCGSETTEKAPSTTASSAQPREPFYPLPPPVNEATVVPAPLSGLQPGVPIMVGDGDETTVWCTAGFYIDYPDPDHPGQRLPAFITAAQCAQGDSRAPVSVMKADAAGLGPIRTKIGAITYLTPGDERPAVAGEPWTIPTSPLAVFSSGQPDWVMPVDVMVNDKMPTSEISQSARPVEQHNAPAMWTNSLGLVVTGHVLKPASTPELKDIPAGIERVVVAADDTTKPVDQWVRGSPVTVTVDGVTYNLGIIVGADETRHWVVVDLIGPFLAERSARLVTMR
jgi:hypothetical protein